MNRLIRCIIALALCSGWLQVSAETQPEQNYRGGTISYINIATLEIGIDDTLFRLDGGFQIHGLGGGSRVEMLQALQPGMYVRYRTSESEPDRTGPIEDILIPAN